MDEHVPLAALHAPRHEYDGYADLLEDYYAKGWTDGLPVVPPTPALVARIPGGGPAGA